MSASLGNKFAAGNHGGRPQHYETVQSMWQKATEYFQYVTSKAGICKPTKSGLMFHLGFATRKSYYDYKEKGKDSNGDNWGEAIGLIDRFIESCYESNLYGFAWGGSAFALKNINGEHWKDKTEQEVSQTITNVSATFGGAIIQPTQEPTINP